MLVLMSQMTRDSLLLTVIHSTVTAEDRTRKYFKRKMGLVVKVNANVQKSRTVI